ncbi:DUF3047 domain-containing protein [Hyphomicrobium sp.]|uniref:DUF3047 domain-containing protein n=2 Tax=Hyphomicrobium sp. TaxID=82 RepID=UPI001327CFC7|nr:MAG: DUF3047 domain-containing protein [Hyphomicrobium sp.]
MRHLVCMSILALGAGDFAGSASADDPILADPAQMLSAARLAAFRGVNSYTVERGPDGLFLRSTPHDTASGLYQELDIEGRDLRAVRWSWRVDILHASADVRDIAREDFGAMLMFVFGEPSFLNRDVPTLAYVWTSTPIANGTILPSLRFQSLRYVQLRGAADVGRLCTETRDIAADFRAIFGREPPELRHVAVFNDNDQTGEAASALFGPVHLVRLDAIGPTKEHPPPRLSSRRPPT